MSPQAGWILQEEIAPRIAAVVPRSILTVGVEDHAELVQDGITMAARMLDRVERQGKLSKVGPSNIAYYTLQHLKSGRRATGSSCVDVHGSMTQLNGEVENHSLYEVVSQSEIGDDIHELHDVISNDTESPDVVAARRMDWAEFCRSLDNAELVIIECLLNGHNMVETALKARVHYSSMQSYRKKLAAKILEFMGVDILREIARTPQWRIGLECNRALLACRAERRN